MSVSEIPLTAGNQRFLVQLSSTTYQLVLTWRNNDQGGWVLDLNDGSGNPLVNGVPLVTGADLLAQYPYLGLGKLYVLVDGKQDGAPTYAGIGTSTRLYYVT